ncbi:SDR family NAD(P)-dependent oxidoreductase [Dactylosporangium sp. NPDC048998]|uniref:SDR family NAD(P)-dependent oxidoreductase n=1 Tax=Dactylosporangium sp. NPDC048998 TaxID=3363976 RepID=UPI003715464E
MRVVVNYRSSDADADAAVEAIRAAGGEAIASRADVRDPREVDELVKAVSAQWGAIEVLVNTVRIPFPIKSFQDMTWEEFGGKLHDERLAAFTLTKAVAPAMIDQGYGRIVHIATGLARQPRAETIALGSSKAALVQVHPLRGPGAGPLRHHRQMWPPRAW